MLEERYAFVMEHYVNANTLLFFRLLDWITSMAQSNYAAVQVYRVSFVGETLSVCWSSARHEVAVLCKCLEKAPRNMGTSSIV